MTRSARCADGLAQKYTLVHAASSLADRPGNVDSMADSPEAHRVATERVRPLNTPLK